MTHTFAATPARSRTLPRASRAPHSKNPLTSTFSEKIQITYAMRLLHAGVDTTVIALWLGHFSGVPDTVRMCSVVRGLIPWLSVLLPIVRRAWM